MQALRQLIPTGTNCVKPTDTTGITDTIVTNKTYENDHLFDQLPDLVNTGFKAWYCKMFYLLGKDEVLKLASIARADGKDPRKVFSILLKKSSQCSKEHCSKIKSVS